MQQIWHYFESLSLSLSSSLSLSLHLLCSYADCLIWVRALFVINYSNCNSLAATWRRGQFNVSVCVYAHESECSHRLQHTTNMFIIFFTSSLYAWENNKKKKWKKRRTMYLFDGPFRSSRTCSRCIFYTLMRRIDFEIAHEIIDYNQQWCKASAFSFRSKCSHFFLRIRFLLLLLLQCSRQKEMMIASQAKTHTSN